jgi:hypothetical protein
MGFSITEFILAFNLEFHWITVFLVFGVKIHSSPTKNLFLYEHLNASIQNPFSNKQYRRDIAIDSL